MLLFKAKALSRAWCYLALLAVAHAALASSSELMPHPESSPDPQPDLAQAADLIVPRVVPLAMQWIGSIGGLLGTISFTENFVTRLVKLILGPKPKDTPEERFYKLMKENERKLFRGKKFPKKEGKPSWQVAIRKQHPILIAPLGE